MGSLSREVLDALRPQLLDGLLRLGLPAAAAPPEELADSLLTYTAELYRFNDKLGLVEAAPPEFIHAHLLDSLTPLPLIAAAGKNLIDLGSGAGLPGIPLALALPELTVTLLDRSGRRCGFLRNAVAILRRPDIEVVQGDLSRAGAPGGAAGESRWRVVTARAFRPLNRALLEQILPLLAPGGTLFLYKGRLTAAEEELSAVLSEFSRVGEKPPEAELQELKVPGLDRERCLLRLRKSA